MASFGVALKCLKEGSAVARREWEEGEYLSLQVPDKHSKMTLPYIYLTTTRLDMVPWLASQTDILSEDWIEVEPEE